MSIVDSNVEYNHYNIMSIEELKNENKSFSKCNNTNEFDIIIRKINKLIDRKTREKELLNNGYLKTYIIDNKIKWIKTYYDIIDFDMQFNLKDWNSIK